MKANNPLRFNSLRLALDQETYRVGDIISGSVRIVAPVRFGIKEISLNVVCTLTTTEHQLKRTFPIDIDVPKGLIEGKLYAQNFEIELPLEHQTGTFGNMRVEWTLQSKAAIFVASQLSRLQPEIHHLEEVTPLRVSGAGGPLHFKKRRKTEDDEMVYALSVICAVFLLMSSFWLMKLLLLFGAGYGVLYLERALTRAYLLRGLEVTLETDTDGQPQFSFHSTRGLDDFTGGVVNLKLEERYWKNYYDSKGNKMSEQISRELINRTEILSPASRRAQRVICSISLPPGPHPASFNFDNYHGYEWTASYVYPRKYWWDVIVPWNLEVSRKPVYLHVIKETDTPMEREQNKVPFLSDLFCPHRT